ncbi:MAG TPA: type I glutamate--ammonia ligase, partial [Anaerolineales bacterium]
KYITKNVAKKYGKTATFMPKPLFQDNGSGMHTHQSLWKGGEPLFAGDMYAGLSQMALWYIGGILKHINSLLAFCAPTTNSYRRLVPHFEAPVNVAFSKRNRSAIVRIPMYYSGDAHAKAKRIEFRAPDPMANPYFAFSAILLAGLDGVKRKIDPVKAGFGPLDKNIWELTGEEKAKISGVPGSLLESVRALEKDHDYLLDGGVFTEDVLSMWQDLKMAEIQEVALRPSPYEFYLYSAV